MRFFDWDRTFFVLEAGESSLEGGEPIVLDRAGWGYFLRHTAGFYVVVFVAYQLVRRFVPRFPGFIATTLVAMAVMVLFLPRLKRPGTAGRGAT